MTAPCAILILCIFAVLLLNSHQCPPGWAQSPVDSSKCYLVVVNKKAWLDAEAYCNSAAPNSHLTSICSAFESSAINSIFNGSPSSSTCDSAWIGLKCNNQTSSISWADNSPCRYTKWAPGQPNPANECVSSQAKTTGQWATQSCSFENCFICDYYQSSTTVSMTTTGHKIMTDCYDWLHYGGATTNGVYRIDPRGSGNQIDVYCDMVTNGGGWTVFQKRLDGNLDFYTKSWQDYKSGFNNGMANNYWLGNEYIHILSTKDPVVNLRLEMWNDRAPGSPYANGHWVGEYIFRVGDESSKYTLFVSSNAFANETGIGLYYNNGSMFSAIDVDNTHTGAQCSRSYCMGGGWFGECSTYLALNGKYIPPDGWSVGVGLFYSNEKYIINPAQTHLKLRKLS